MLPGRSGIATFTPFSRYISAKKYRQGPILCLILVTFSSWGTNEPILNTIKAGLEHVLKPKKVQNCPPPPIPFIQSLAWGRKLVSHYQKLLSPIDYQTDGRSHTTEQDRIEEPQYAEVPTVLIKMTDFGSFGLCLLREVYQKKWVGELLGISSTKSEKL